MKKRTCQSGSTAGGAWARTRTLGPTHAETLTARENLAYTRTQAGDHDTAAREFEVAVEARIAKHGPRHVETLMTQANLGHVRLNLGDAVGAARSC